MILERHFSALKINDILNHPGIRPWVADESLGVIDVQKQLDNKANVLLMGEHGGILFLQIYPGVYEAHTQVLPEARGEWTKDLTESAAHWMYTKTDCYEVLTRVPKGHIAAKTAAINAGMKYNFTRKDGCLFRGRVLPVHIYSSKIQDWVLIDPYVSDKGVWFHERLHEEAKRLGIKDIPHENDDNHNRFVGASYEMISNGQIYKSIVFYNRWAVVSRHATVSLISTDPVLVRFDVGVLKLVGKDIEVICEDKINNTGTGSSSI